MTQTKKEITVTDIEIHPLIKESERLNFKSQKKKSSTKSCLSKGHPKES